MTLFSIIMEKSENANDNFAPMQKETKIFYTADEENLIEAFMQPEHSSEE